MLFSRTAISIHPSAARSLRHATFLGDLVSTRTPRPRCSTSMLRLAIVPAVILQKPGFLHIGVSSLCLSTAFPIDCLSIHNPHSNNIASRVVFRDRSQRRQPRPMVVNICGVSGCRGVWYLQSMAMMTLRSPLYVVAPCPRLLHDPRWVSRVSVNGR